MNLPSEWDVVCVCNSCAVPCTFIADSVGPGQIELDALGCPLASECTDNEPNWQIKEVNDG
jgi:hypothetical protein